MCQNSLWLYLFEVFGELRNGACSVRDAVLDIHAELCERLLVAFGHEDRVVAEALCALLLARYGAAHDALEERVVGNVAAACESYHGAELRTAVVAVAQACEQLLHVGFRVVVGALGVACRVDARFASKLGHFEARVVGEAVVAVVVYYVARLLNGVALKRVGCFGYVCVAVDVFEREHVEAVAEYGAYLRELVLVVCGEDDSPTPSLPVGEGI